jgi:hypothetical protein
MRALTWEQMQENLQPAISPGGVVGGEVLCSSSSPVSVNHWSRIGSDALAFVSGVGIVGDAIADAVTREG